MKSAWRTTISPPPASWIIQKSRDIFADMAAGKAIYLAVVEGGCVSLSLPSRLNLVGAAQVGKSSLTGMRLLHRAQSEIPVWPFDPDPGYGSLIVEIYTSLAALAAGKRKGQTKIFSAEELDSRLTAFSCGPHEPFAAKYNDHATDALLTAAWLRHAHASHALWQPDGLTPNIARTEGWTFGVR
jgi:hypothetical protein